MVNIFLLHLGQEFSSITEFSYIVQHWTRDLEVKGLPTMLL